MTLQQQLKRAIEQRDSLIAYLTGKNKPTGLENQLKIIREVAELDRQVRLLELTPFKDRNKTIETQTITATSKL